MSLRKKCLKLCLKECESSSCKGCKCTDCPEWSRFNQEVRKND